MIKAKCHPFWKDKNGNIEYNKSLVSPAVTANGYLYPCCWLDTGKPVIDKKLHEIGMCDKNINDNTIKEIFESKAWIKFHKELFEGRSIIEQCYKKCGINEL